MSGDKGTNPCNKFQANIFNKSKCQNCFKSRELHLLTDHSMDKAKPVYGGWLCLAPEGTDFTNPMHRSRKWQRRFFILYEHGSLTFALDELPSTLPQGTVNMTQCTEVLDAEPHTGQRNALCIAGPHLELFIRAESRDIIHGWCEQLAVYPRTNKHNLKKKRKVELATSQEPSPAKMAATELCFSAMESAPVAPGSDARLGQEEEVSRGSEGDSVWTMTNADKPPAELVASRDPPLTSDPSLLSISSCTSLSSLDSISDLTADLGLESPPNPDPDPMTPPAPGRRTTSPAAPLNSLHPSAQSSDQKTPRRRHQEREGRTSVEQPESGLTEVAQEAGHNLFRKGRSHQREKLLSCKEAPVTQLSAPPPQRRAHSLDRRTSESTMTPDLLNFKKGWLVKLDKGDQWRKYWFVLSADSLRYYKDSAEEVADMEGDMDLTQCYNVSDYQVHRNYGFQIHTRKRVYTLSAMTAGIRRNWIQALLKNVHPSNAPDVASVPGRQLHPFSPLESLPKPDITQESLPPLAPLHAEGDPLLGPRLSRARERRREGRSKTFDWAEFRPPLASASTPTSSLSPTGEKTEASSEAELGEAGRKRRREERRRRYESVLGFPLGWELERGDGEEEEGRGVLSPQARRKVQEEIERCWQQVERVVLRWDQNVALCPETRGDGATSHTEPCGNIPVHPDSHKTASLPSSTQSREYSDRLERLLDKHSKMLDTPPSPEVDLDATTTNQKPSSYQSLTDTYRETKELLQQQQLIRQSLQQQLNFSETASTNQGLSDLSSTTLSNQKPLGFSRSIAADQHHPGSSSTTPPANWEQLGLSLLSVSSNHARRYSDPQPPSIWLQDTEGNLQELQRSDPVFLAASPGRDLECRPAPLPQPGGVGGPDLEQNHWTTPPSTGVGGGGRRRWVSTPDTRRVGETRSPDPFGMERSGQRSNDLAGGEFDHCWDSGSREKQSDSDPGPGSNQGTTMVRHLAQDVALLTSQNQALNQRNQEMVNQLTEADREIERLRAELLVWQSASRKVREEEERAAQDRTREEGMEAELCRKTRQLQEAQSLTTSLEGHLRHAETQLQIKEAELQGLRGQEEEGEDIKEEENEEEDKEAKEEEEVEEEEVEEEEEEEEEQEKKTDLGEDIEEVEEEGLELDTEVTEEDGEAPLRREEDEERRRSPVPEEKPFEQTCGDPEMHDDKLRGPVTEDDAGGEAREGGDRVEQSLEGERRIQRVVEEMMTRSKILGHVLEVVEGSALSMLPGNATVEREPWWTTTTGKRLRLEEEFWTAVSASLKAGQSQGSKDEDEELFGSVLSWVAEGMAVEKRMLRLANRLLHGAQVETDSRRWDQPDDSLGDPGITDDTSAETMPQMNEEEDGTVLQKNEEKDEDGWLLLSGGGSGQQGDIDDAVSSRFAEITQIRMSLYKQIASSIRASADDQHRSETSAYGQLRSDTSSNDQLWFDTSTNKQLRSIAYSLSQLPSLQYPWSSSVHCVAAEPFSAYRFNRLQAQHQTEIQRTKLGLGLPPSLPCSRCADLERENQELRGRLEARNLGHKGTALENAHSLAAPDEEGSVVCDGHSLGACKEEANFLREKEGEGKTKQEVRCGEEVEKREEVERLRKEEVWSLSARVRHLEDCLSAVAKEMKEEHDGRLASLRLEHNRDLEELKARYEQCVSSLQEGHRRMLGDVQQRQQLVLEKLRGEQERLLEEETAATITAIAAMKKVYQAELEREVQRACLANGSQGHAHLEDLHRRHREELAGCQRELEVLSQQYALRCLEAAHLEQALGAERQALGTALEENRCLHTHNQELTVQLAAEVSRWCSPAQQVAPSSGPKRDLYELEISVRVRDCEVTCLKQEVTSLRDQLHIAQQDKRRVTEQFQEVSSELSAVRTQTDRDLDSLRQNLHLAHRALEEQPRHTHNGVYTALLL